MASFEHFSEALAQSESPLPPAEVHGLMSALVCVPGVGRMSVLQGEVQGPDVDAPAAAPVRAMLQKAWEHTTEALDATDFTFDLLLPDDEEPLEQRTAALGSWCHGFLAGLGLAGVGEHHKALSGDAREFLDDVQEMSRIESDPEEDDEAEAAYAELVEYLRVGVLLLREEIGSLAARNTAIGRLH